VFVVETKITANAERSIRYLEAFDQERALLKIATMDDDIERLVKDGKLIISKQLYITDISKRARMLWRYEKEGEIIIEDVVYKDILDRIAGNK